MNKLPPFLQECLIPGPFDPKSKPMPLPSPIQAALDHQHEMLPQYLKGISNRDLRSGIIPGKWSAHEQVAHLCSYQPVFRERIRRILEEQNPIFEPYRAEKDPEFPGYVALTATELIQRMNRDRDQIREELSVLSENQMERRGNHQDFGSMNLPTWVSFFILHEAHHHFAILKIARMLLRVNPLPGPEAQ